LHNVGPCEIRSPTPECMARTPGSRPIVSACDAAKSYRRTVNQSRQDSSLILHADQRVIIVRTDMATIEDPRPQTIASLEQKAARQLRRPTDLAHLLRMTFNAACSLGSQRRNHNTCNASFIASLASPMHVPP